MDDRIIEFIRALRAGGVPVSTSESLDALNALKDLGISHRGLFHKTLRTTLVKSHADFELFDELFLIYFAEHDAAMQDALDDFAEDEQDLIRSAISEFDDRIQQLLEWLTSGEPPTQEQLQAMMNQSGIEWATNAGSAVWVSRRMLQQMGFWQLEDRLRDLSQRLQEMGLGQESIQRLLGVVEVNRERLSDYVGQQVQLEISRRQANRPQTLQGSDLTHKSFSALSAADLARLKQEIRRLIMQLKTRAALRNQRATQGKFDVRWTMRQSLRTYGIPLQMRHKRKKLKPDIVLIFDVSNSMQTVIEFLLHFVVEMQDQLSRLRSFAFYDNLGEVTHIVKEADIRELPKTFNAIQQSIPAFLWRTNLGNSMQTFFHYHLSSINSKSTVIVIGDARNNYADPRLDLVETLQKRVNKLVWLTPEGERMWGSGDSDMDKYAPLCDEVYQIKNLAQLADALDKLLVA